MEKRVLFGYLFTILICALLCFICFYSVIINYLFIPKLNSIFILFIGDIFFFLSCHFLINLIFENNKFKKDKEINKGEN